MEKFHHIVRSLSLSQLAIIYTGFLSSGVTLAVLVRNRYDWLNWSFSALGEHGTVSAMIFNATILLSSGILWRLTDKLARELRAHHNTEAAKWTQVFLRLVVVCLVGIALSPNDTHHQAHIIAGYGLVVIFSVYTLILPLTVTKLSRGGYVLAYSMPVLALILSVHGAVGRNMPFVLYELILGALIFLWLTAFCFFVEKQAIPLQNPSR